MALKSTSAEERKELAATGFVRVDGLKVDGIGNYVIGPEVRWLGKFDGNNGMTVIVTVGSEVWLAKAGGSEERRQKMTEIFLELCPRGRGAFVSCSNGEQLRWSDILQRMADPDWRPSRPSH